MIELPKSKVMIVGAGIAGLMIAHRLAQYGLHPTVVEASEKIAAGATIRNQGWLHAGTIHAQSIADPNLSTRVAQRCMYGHDYFRRFCPEAVENPTIPSLAVTLSEERIPEIIDRWEEAGVAFRPITRRSLETRCPAILSQNVAASWIVKDLTIDSRVVCSRLAVAIQRDGGCVFTRCRIGKLRLGDASFESYGVEYKLSPAFVIVAAGHWTNEILTTHWNMTVAMRFWKSHLLVTRRVPGAAVFAVDDGEAGIVHHGDRSVAGMTGDNVLCLEPSNEVDQAEAEKIRAALSRLIAIPTDAPVVPFACTKVDIVDQASSIRNLDVEVVNVSQNVLAVFPGKMTEAPFLADIVAREVVEALNGITTNDRPIDSIKVGAPVVAAL
ncbi:MAG: FAD-binding oxidoreductase [Proteobacteria bacterium]|nr:FAD-binding oxidoreductase [Pseudomonadota bacterium]